MLELYMNRIAKAKRASLLAQSAWAEEYWLNVSIELEKKLSYFE